MSVGVISSVYNGIVGAFTAVKWLNKVKEVGSSLKGVLQVGATLYSIVQGRKSRKENDARYQASKATETADRNLGNVSDAFQKSVAYIRATGVTPSGSDWRQLSAEQQGWVIDGDYTVVPPAERVR